jgi:hypothetical protein
MFNDTNSLKMINNLLVMKVKKQSNWERSYKIKPILNYLKKHKRYQRMILQMKSSKKITPILKLRFYA